LLKDCAPGTATAGKPSWLRIRASSSPSVMWMTSSWLATAWWITGTPYMRGGSSGRLAYLLALTALASPGGGTAPLPGYHPCRGTGCTTSPGTVRAQGTGHGLLQDGRYGRCSPLRPGREGTPPALPKRPPDTG